MKKNVLLNDFEDDFDCFDNVPNDSVNTQSVLPLSQAALLHMTLLDKLEELIKITRGCELKPECLEQNKELIQSIADELKLTPSQVIMLCPYINRPNGTLDTSDLQNYFDCSAITIMRHADDLKALQRRRYLVNNNSFHMADNMYITERAKKALCNNSGLPVVKTSELTPIEFMNMFRTILLDYGKLHYIDQEAFEIEVTQLIADNPQLQLVQAINNLRVSDGEKIVILRFCKALVLDGEEGIPLDSFENDVFDFYEFSTAIFRGEHLFVKEGLLTPFAQHSLFSRDIYGLTHKARNIFLSEYDLPREFNNEESFEHAHLIYCKDIKPKALYYSTEDQGQIDTLKGLLEDKQLKAIRKRLDSANMRKGFNCLFYGLPGTGKTETAHQLARLTKRDILQVNISEMRDKWYGETEKIVKGIFDDYAGLVKRSKRIPILLINEADALLSVRTSIGGNNPTIEKTENAIQNILLESMENIDGILIATTNLTCNLDSAFERRFLYKVQFHQPSTEAKVNIWKSFLPSLNEPNALVLASSFDFSGGQIENIARKVMVDQLLYGTSPDLEHIKSLCAQETLSGNRARQRPIGFKTDSYLSVNDSRGKLLKKNT
ncbi:MAG: AAA family ATPase [Bacteroidales bacterium]|nr:AAA family ATPase [Bacteroidales bacterium]